MIHKSDLPVDRNRVSQYLTELSIPRLAGTDMEKKTAARIEEHFRSQSFVVTREPFEFGTTSMLIGKVFVAMFPAFLFICQFLLHSLPLLSFLSSLGIILLFCFVTRNSAAITWLGHNWRKKFKSQNIIATKTPKFDEKIHLILGAHYDSINLTRNIYGNHYRMICILLPVFFVTIGLLSVIGIIGLISSITGFELPPVAFKIFIGISILLTLFFTTYMVTGHGNSSAGAADNASGVAALMELSNIFKDQALKDLRISFVAFGAEEMGLMGSNHYFFRHRDELTANRTHMISVDMVGAKGKFGYVEKYGIPPKRTDPFLNKMIKQAAKKLGVKCEKIEVPPFSGSDHDSFDQRGVPATFLGAVSKMSMKTLHTSKDDLNAIDNDNLFGAVCLLNQLIWDMDESL